MNDQTAPAPGDTLLDLDLQAPERYSVLIRTKENREGTLYEFRDFEELSLEEQGELAARGEQLAAIRAKAHQEFNAEIGKRLAMVLDHMLLLLLPDLPDDVRARLDDNKKIKLVESFTEASPQLADAVREARAKAQPSPTR